MKAARYIPALAIALALTAYPAAAQTGLGGTAYFSDGVTEVVYAPFTVNSGGFFTFETFGNTLDAYIWLFGGAATDGAGLGGWYTFDDDDGAGVNSRISNFFLGSGGYTLAMSVYHFTEAEARSGVNDHVSCSGPGCSYTWSISSPDGVAEPYAASVPEPMTAMLLVSGLLGVGLAVRRRRSSDV